jgi:N-acetylmuramoyl-L-alanine amidase CwlA
MAQYNIDINHVVRHYDVTGKLCPGIIGWNLDSGSEKEWTSFKNRLSETAEEDEDMT